MAKVKVIFITHTVQMERCYTTPPICLIRLYNPHGSDGTVIYPEGVQRKSYFITHTVQMERQIHGGYYLSAVTL